jgi:hypothetical protein
VLTGVGELIGSQWPIFAVTVVWAFFPVVMLLIYVAGHGGVLTGANGSDTFDQMQYLAWIRDEGSHLLASNLWQVGGTPHDYLHPMYVVSGLLWRLGLSVQLAYLVWKPVAVLVLFVGFAAYVRHLLPAKRSQQAAALFLGLFYLSPVYALAQWTGHLTDAHRYAVLLATDDADSALNLWGFEHAAIAIGLMPAFLIATERALAAAHGPSRRPWSALGTRWSALAAVAGALVSWLHPWQGVMLVVVVGLLFLLAPPRRRFIALVVPVTATLLPLAYGLALSHFDASWHTFSARTIGVDTAPWWALIASFGPLVLFAAFAVRRPRDDRSWMLALWLVACAGVYFLLPQFPPHALSGVTLPLSVLAVQGWQRVAARVPAPRRLVAALALAGVLVMTVPAAVYHATASLDYYHSDVAGAFARQLVWLSDDQAAALSYLSRTPQPGAVLAPWLLSMSVPGLTGRQAFAGHGMWQPSANVTEATAFFSPSINDPTGAFRRAILRHTRVRFVLADCSAPASLARAIAPIASLVVRFGCVTVYETRQA